MSHERPYPTSFSEFLEWFRHQEGEEGEEGGDPLLPDRPGDQRDRDRLLPARVEQLPVRGAGCHLLRQAHGGERSAIAAASCTRTQRPSARETTIMPSSTQRAASSSSERNPGQYVPQPLGIRCEETDSTPREIGEEVLALTKMNWNNTQFAQPRAHHRPRSPTGWEDPQIRRRERSGRAPLRALHVAGPWACSRGTGPQKRSTRRSAAPARRQLRARPTRARTGRSLPRLLRCGDHRPRG